MRQIACGKYQHELRTVNRVTSADHALWKEKDSALDMKCLFLKQNSYNSLPPVRSYHAHRHTDQ